MLNRLRQNPDILAIAVLSLLLGVGRPGTFSHSVSAPSTFGVRLIRNIPAARALHSIEQAIRNHRSASECPLRLEIR